MAQQENPDVPEEIETYPVLPDDADATLDQHVAIELPVEPGDANAQPT